MLSNFDTAELTKTYNNNSASMVNPNNNEMFSIQTAYDYNTYNHDYVTVPYSTEVGCWYYFTSNIELGVQYDKSRLYNSDSHDLLYKINSGIVSIYYHLKDHPKLPVNMKIGSFYGEISIEGEGLKDDIVYDHDGSYNIEVAEKNYYLKL